MTEMPPELLREVRQKLRTNAGRWIARFYRRELLVARTITGMEIEMREEWRREIVQPLLRQIGGRLAEFPARGRNIYLDQFPQLAALEREATAIVNRGSDAVRRLTTERLDELTRDEREWVERSAQRELDLEPQRLQVRENPSERPILGERPERWFGKMLAEPTGDRVRSWVQTGIQEGLSTDEIVRGLKGTRTQRGILAKSDDDVGTLVRTAANSASAEVRLDAFEDLGVDKWDWVLTLDSRTCPVCVKNEKGGPYPMGEGPTLPAHPNCRCSPVPHFPDDLGGTRASERGPVDSSTTFEQWFRGQSAAEQNRQIGVAKAKAWRRGDLSFDDMVGRDLQPLSLAELRRMGRL